MVTARTTRSRTTASRPDTVEVEVTARRDEIVEAALRLFATKGYRATTMADIGERLGIRGPSLYKHIGSKQELLVEIMNITMDGLIRDQRAAVATATSVDLKLRRAVEAHVRWHTRMRDLAFVGAREIDSLEPEHRRKILAKHSKYERVFRSLIETGRDEGVFEVASAKLASFAIVDMGMRIAVWFHDDGPMTADEIAYSYGDFALRLVGAH